MVEMRLSYHQKELEPLWGPKKDKERDWTLASDEVEREGSRSRTDQVDERGGSNIDRED
jgi:hypothetical protein